MAINVRPGKPLTIKAGTYVKRAGRITKRSLNSTVTVRRTEPARDNKVRVYWKSHGVIASALI